MIAYPRSFYFVNFQPLDTVATMLGSELAQVSANDRVAIIERLAHYLTPLGWNERYGDELRQRELSAGDIVPTIGAEIEIPWSARFPQLAGIVFSEQQYSDMSDSEKVQFNQLCAELDEQYLPLYRTTQELGVPRDPFQKFWEFAHQPARWYETLAKEISLLMRSDLIPTHQPLSLHVTLGNIALASGSYYVQLLTELSYGCDGNRIRQAVGDMPIYQRRWARKAANGTKERKASELYGADQGFEMRTLVAQTPEQIERVLKTAQLLGAALNGFRSKDDKGLKNFWVQAVQVAKSIETRTGIKVNRPWFGPKYDPELWLSYAELLDGKGELEETLMYVRFEVAKICQDIEDLIFGTEISRYFEDSSVQ